jgi:hypothetical protein
MKELGILKSIVLAGRITHYITKYKPKEIRDVGRPRKYREDFLGHGTGLLWPTCIMTTLMMMMIQASRNLINILCLQLSAEKRDLWEEINIVNAL